MSLAEEVAALLPQGLVTGYMGVVKSVVAGKPTVDVRGALLPVTANVGYSPVVGDNVMIMRIDNANSWMVAFKVSAGQSTGAAPASDWIPAPLANGWVPWGGFAVPGHRQDADGAVYLNGMAGGGAKTSDTMFVLPPLLRPRSTLMFPVAASDGQGLVTVNPSGAVNRYNGVQTWMSLNGISFHP